jgi:predicted nucleotidyltransferase
VSILNDCTRLSLNAVNMMPRRFDFAQLPLTDKDRAAVLEAAQVLVDHLPVERVVLYGSKARGDDRADSDVDLLILTTRPLSVAEGFQVTDLLQPVQHRHHCIISPLRLSSEEWYRGVYQVLGIRHEIDRDGIDVPLRSNTRQTRQPEPSTR